MTRDSKLLAEAYATQIPVASPVTAAPAMSSPAIMQSKPLTTPLQSQNNQETAKSTLKDWIRLPYINTPFKARMAAVLIIELINTMVKDQDMRELVFKEIRANNRLQKKFK